MNRTTPQRLLAAAVFLLLCPWAGVVRAAAPDAPVAVRDDAGTATLSNGIVTATVNKANGNLLSLRYRDKEMLSHGGAYMNLYGETTGQPKTQDKPGPSEYRVTHDPAQNGGALGEAALRFPFHGQPGAVPMDIEIRYTLHRGDSGLYAWTLAHHQPPNPGFNIEAGTICLKLNPDIFDFLSVDSRRQRHMISGEDWTKGQQLNLWEARRMTTGIHKGDVEHKYDYSAMFSQTPAYGWSSTKDKVGVYVVNPSTEYIIGSPTKVDLTGHIDLKTALPADPTLLFVWHSNHYGGKDIQVNAGDDWEKVIGPILILCDHNVTPEAMWHDAMARAAQEQKAWPYAWADAPGYPHADQRGSAQGQLVVRDPQDPAAKASGAWVGLAAAPYQATFAKGGPVTIGWETDGKHYQYWTRADAAGRFTVPNARPGTYTLYAFNDGILGEFSRADVTIAAGQTTQLGSLTWTPVRYGRQLWDIGIPNRSAEEFRHGDHYWQWGLYNLYPQEFPKGVDYVIGKSDWHTDWNYAQPPVADGAGGWKGSTWRIEFPMPQASAGTATLRLAICGFRGGPIDASLNGSPIGSTGDVPDDGVMHRDGIRGTEIERDIKFDASRLKPGNNVIELTKQAKSWPEGVLYDYLRLELDPNAPFAP